MSSTLNDAFESTDSVRTARPLSHVQFADFPVPFALERGGLLPSLTVAYETYGELNEARDNAVLICHALTGDSHVAAHNADDDAGWWDALVGPNKGIDTNKHFVICCNVLGGCRGTTGPSTIDLATGKPYGNDFPLVTVHDMVNAQKRVIDLLKIQKLRAVVGGSFGGHQALSWATRYPDYVQTAVVIASSSRLSSQALAFDVVGRNAIQTDPYYAEGQYYDNAQHPETGLALARMLGHITYLSSASMAKKFDMDRHEPRQLQTEFEKRFSVGSYLAYQGSQFVRRFDANSYVAITLAMDLVDFGATREELAEALSAAQCDWLVVSLSSDWPFHPRNRVNW
ncbi:MAG: homoserine O-acetyltransferase [Polyangiales bacterium]